MGSRAERMPDSLDLFRQRFYGEIGLVGDDMSRTWVGKSTL